MPISAPDQREAVLSRRDGGFTVLEVVIAMTLVALLTSVVTVNLRSMVERAREASALQQLDTVIAVARDETLKRSNPVSLSAVNVRVFPDTADRLVFDRPDALITPGLCPATGGRIETGRRSLAFTIDFATCRVSWLSGDEAEL